MRWCLGPHALLGICITAALAAAVTADPQALFAAVAADDPSAIERALERTDINSIGYYSISPLEKSCPLHIFASADGWMPFPNTEFTPRICTGRVGRRRS